MKKIISIIFILNAAVTPGLPQSDTVWRSGGITSLNFTQVSLTNWAAGGDNSISGNALVSLFGNMKKGKWSWDNTLDMAFGGSKIADAEIRKTDDKIDLNSKAGYNFSNKYYLTYLLGFKTQFTEGFQYTDAGRTRISHFLTPGYVLNALGIDWKPNDDVSVFLSPITIKTTIVNDQLLVDQAELAGIKLYGVDPGKKIRNEVGAYFAGKYSKKIMENVVFNTKLELFSNYSNDPQNLDVNWETIISFKVNEFVNAIVTTQLLYDNDVFVPKDEVNAPPGPGTQFKQTFGIGFAYKFNGYGVK